MLEHGDELLFPDGKIYCLSRMGFCCPGGVKPPDEWFISNAGGGTVFKGYYHELLEFLPESCMIAANKWHKKEKQRVVKADCQLSIFE
ncbi:hypothetical protein NLX67_15985 [Domibacillus sp. A3M-37]|uniref:hypothetical protein n=1 Tax=Domibacillus sp. A3M-37 TaxID=2962037 RepID=UPI0020B847E3|nr:hypothetical protein [Domibacillus sp. A3M-37]MCP3763872.1 hypothetical protein [Domibacillus sp. A3M-37]